MIWFAIVALGAITFLFAGMEAGLLSIDPVRLRSHVKQRTPGARRLARLLEQPERPLVTVLLVTNVAEICSLLLATRALVGLYGRAGYFITVAAAIPIYLFLLGVLPKSLFRRFPLRALSALGGILEGASYTLWPVLEIGQRLGKWLFPRPTSAKRRLFAAREELKQVAVQSEREGSLTAVERAMIHNVVDFRNVRARDVMTPLRECLTVEAGTPVEAVLELSRTSGRDRFPVLSRAGDAIGLVNVLEILLDKSAPASLSRYTRRIVLATENEPAYRVIQRLRAARLRLAAVIDSRKNLVGIATDEELIKRLVRSA
ncbi:MAG TPA: CNNM domain-containing protein [Chthoniobacterales bacterium]|nr:CNNM domain-containing protein [Chthoniobacterales bacterium]